MVQMSNEIYEIFSTGPHSLQVTLWKPPLVILFLCLLCLLCIAFPPFPASRWRYLRIRILLVQKTQDIVIPGCRSLQIVKEQVY